MSFPALLPSGGPPAQLMLSACQLSCHFRITMVLRMQTGLHFEKSQAAWQGLEHQNTSVLPYHLLPEGLC